MRRQSGFTLLELIITLAIITLLASGAVFSFSSAMQALRERQAKTRFNDRLRTAQIKAVEEGRPWALFLDPVNGKNLTLKYWVSNNPAAVTWDCTAPEWVTYQPQKQQQHSLPQSITMDPSSFSRDCLPFATTGRSVWPNPTLRWAESDDPDYGGAEMTSAPKLVDGILSEIDPGDLWAAPGVVGWYKPGESVTLVMDVGESRHFSEVKIGVLSCGATCSDSYLYPSGVSVWATNVTQGSPPAPPALDDQSQWTLRLSETKPVSGGEGSMPVDPVSGDFARAWITVPFPVLDPVTNLKNAYRYLKIELATDGDYVVVDELGISDLQITMKGPLNNYRIGVKPVTGSIKVETVQP